MVSEINLRLQLRLLEVRRELERLMASLAAERATPDERREFAEVAQAMLAAAAKADDIAFMRLDQRFNILIATAARNEFARRSMGLMNALSRRFWYQHYQEVADLPLAAKLHAAVADAVAQKKVKAAATASDRLIDYIEDFARKTLDSCPGERSSDTRGSGAYPFRFAHPGYNLPGGSIEHNRHCEWFRPASMPQTLR